MRILLIGFGDVAQRWAAQHRSHPARQHVQWSALVRRDNAAAQVRALGGRPIVGDLDDFRKLARLKRTWDRVLYFAPPPNAGDDDPRLRRALALLRGRIGALVYVSTTGVYGDCGGAWVSETRRVNPESSRAQRRVAAEQQLRRARNVCSMRLRVPGIYAHDRLPLARLRAGTPALLPEEDAYSNHIHADDLARITWLATFRGRAQRAYNITDDAQLKMGDWFDLIADAHALPRPPRMRASQAREEVGPMMWSFMRESRRIENARMKRELRVKLRYPTPMVK